MLKRMLLLLFAVIGLISATTGCRTAHGAGEDMEKAGDKIQQNTPP